jgi:hypothetical protein
MYRNGFDGCRDHPQPRSTSESPTRFQKPRRTASPNGEEKAISQTTSFDSRDIAIFCLSGALVLVVIALIVVLASR